MRLDIFLVEKGFFPSREKAKLAIVDGKVTVNNKIRDKASFETEETDNVEVAENTLLKYVSLGGMKLEKAIETFDFDFKGKKVLDIGASTGGFTDCALQHGADFVFAVDVGTEQLHESLHAHEQIQSFENQNIRDFVLPEKVEVIVMDVSFVSQTTFFPDLNNFLTEDGTVISLIKPQFELDQRIRFSNGIVIDKKLHLKVLKNIVTAAGKNGLYIQGICVAPIFPKKNIEYLAIFSNTKAAKVMDLKKFVGL